MIFVTVGTHEQQFNRLVKYMDELASKNIFAEEIIIQTGYSDYMPKYATYSKFYSYSEMQKKYKDARIIITHGGPSSFMGALMIGKTPIVVPRMKKYGEHVNNHQVEFCSKVYNMLHSIIYVEDVKDILSLITNFELHNNYKFDSNNINFCIKISDILNYDI